MLFSRPGEPLCSSEEPTLLLGSFFQVLLAELAGFITGRRGGTGFVGDLLLPVCWSFPRPFPLTFLLTASPQHIPWKLHPADSGAALLWALGEAALRDLQAEGVEMAPSIGHEPDPGHRELQITLKSKLFIYVRIKPLSFPLLP